MTDYWLSKLFFDLQAPGMGKAWRDDRTKVLEDYPLSPEMREAVLKDDIRILAPHVNAYLLRFYLAISGYDDPTSMGMLHALKPGADSKEQRKETAHG
ncbi:MAG: hypothetical protein WD470_02365 [Rhodospirillaceae bacterium]